MNRIKKLAIAIAVGGTLASMAGTAAAGGPGKPGDNPIAPGGDIVAVAKAANAKLGEFDYLLAAVGCLTDASGANPIIDALTGDDKLTLFAPTDAAFEALQTTLGLAPPAPEKTCGLGPETVAQVLTYHVTDGRRFSNSVFNVNNSKPIGMLNGASITSNPDLTFTDVAGQSVGVVPGLVNINASNGVVHVIDTVLLPF